MSCAGSGNTRTQGAPASPARKRTAADGSGIPSPHAGAYRVLTGHLRRCAHWIEKVASLRDKLEAEAALPGGLEVVNQAIAAFKDVG